MRIACWTILCGSLIALCACERGAPAPAGDHADHAHHHDHESMGVSEGEPKEKDAPAGPRIETGSFLLAVAPSKSGYRVGKRGEVEIALESRGPWHVNQEYPIRVDLSTGSAVALDKKELVKDDAQEFGEKKVRFVAEVEPSEPGEHEVSCDVSFAMCTDENCILERRTVTTKLDVE
ncbi:MAG: hypothetical protein PVH21_09815 [Myxococcales bacterium]|jgi:hypothetical protein